MSPRVKEGFTLVELAIVIVSIALLAGLMLSMIAARIRFHKQTCCKQNLSQIGKACGMYAEIGGSLGLFPDYGNGNPMHSLNLLYGTYIDDPDVFSCPSRPTLVKGLKKATEDKFTPNLGDKDAQPGCSYGYDSGHRDTHGLAGIAADAGEGKDGSKKSN